MTQLDLDGLNQITNSRIQQQLESLWADMNVEAATAIDGDLLKQAGIAATLAAERKEWRERAIELLGNYARLAKRPFSMDEFRRAWQDLGYGEPHHANTWGAVMNAAARRNLIAPTGEWVESVRPEAHRRFVRLWRAV